jgi:general nucleoside transport system ATP-binding protein
MVTPDSPIVLQAKGIVKRFPGVLANDHVDFELRKGEVHVLLGENGAGKTTLMNILYGLYKPDEGELFVDGQPIHPDSPGDAIKHGIGMVHQHFMLIPVFSVTENIMLGSETDHRQRGAGPVPPMDRLERKNVATIIADLSKQYGLEVDPNAMVGDLPVGVQQRVEIVKALYRKAHILILDEPTAVLTPQEADELFGIMRELTSQGVSIVFITHKLREVLAVADRITVMRAGKVVGNTTPAESNRQSLASMMVGREVILTVEKGPAKLADVVLQVEKLTVQDMRGLRAVNGISFEVRAGEVLGIAGVQGNGQTELVEALTGLRSAESGHFHIGERDLTNSSPRTLTATGLAHIPEDRQRHGLVLNYTIVDNFALCDYYRPPYSGHGIINRALLDSTAVRLIHDFDVRTPSPFIPAGKLSGGNQQKVIVARELSREVKLLIASQPTRGLDVGSIEYIHNEIIAMRDRGVAVLVISAELDEILSLSDRIAVMYRGEIVKTVKAGEATREELGLWMAGGHTETA